jgi:predicted dehydrogenase
MTQEPIRAALVGTGGIARAHMNAVKQTAGRIEVVAAVEPDAARLDAFSEEQEIPGRYADIDAMLAAEQPQVVLICTPPYVHCELSVKSMDAGAWVLCEKPLCASLAEMDRIEEAEARNGVYCSSVFQWRFGAAGQHLKRLIDTGALGKPLINNTLITWYRTPE